MSTVLYRATDTVFRSRHEVADRHHLYAVVLTMTAAAAQSIGLAVADGQHVALVRRWSAAGGRVAYRVVLWPETSRSPVADRITWRGSHAVADDIAPAGGAALASAWRSADRIAVVSACRLIAAATL